MSDFLLSNHVAGTIYNPVNGDRVQFSKLPADPNLNGYLPESLEQTYLNTKAQAAKRHTVRLSGTDISDGKIGLLEEWRDAETPVCIAIAGNLNMMWEEPVPITDLLTYKPRISEGNQAFGVELTVEGRNKKVWYVENLLSPLGWKDADGNGQADGYVFTGSVGSNTFISDVQSNDPKTSGGSAGVFAAIVFPITGVSITVSSNYISNNGAEGVIIEQLEHNTSSINKSGSTINGAGISSLTLETLAPVYTVRAWVVSRISGGTQGTIYSAKYPALTTNGKLTPGTSFLTP